MKKALFFLSLLTAGMAPTLNAQNVDSKEKIKRLLAQVNYEKNLSEKDLLKLQLLTSTSVIPAEPNTFTFVRW